MDRVTDFESGGCAFDPRRGHLSIPLNENTHVTSLLLERLERISDVWNGFIDGLHILSL